MVGSSKILTVSYGTFSCTLEGFDDSFSTMKAIAEYFRDLAADDRYFGAEPPTPDADMLARIAEKEISRRVEARTGDNGIVLRAGSALDAADAAAQAGGDTVSNTEAPAPIAKVEAPVEAAAPVQSDFVAPAMPPVEDVPAAAFVAPAANTETAPVSAYRPTEDGHRDADSIAAKLQRIRSVVGRGAAAGTVVPMASDEDYADEVAETESTDTFDTDLTAAVEDTPEVEDDVETPVEVAQDEVTDLPEADDAPEELVAESAEVEAEAEEVADAETADADVADPDSFFENDETEALASDDALSEYSEYEDEVTDEDTSNSMIASLLSGDAAVSAEVQDDELTDTAEDNTAEIDEAPETVVPTPVRPRVIKMRRSEMAQSQLGAMIGAASADADETASDEGGSDNDMADITDTLAEAAETEALVELDDDTQSLEDLADLSEMDGFEGTSDDLNSTSTLSAEAEEELQAELASLQNLDLEDAPQSVDSYEDEAEVAMDDSTILSNIASATANTDDVFAGADDVADDLAARADDSATGLLDDADGALDDFDDTADSAADDLAASLDTAAEAASETASDLASDATNPLRKSPDADSAGMDRIMDQTDAELAQPDSSRRREAIAQLKAAVAATEAARRMGDTSAGAPDAVESTANAFREDLQAVRPTRPVRPSRPITRTERPKSTPLKLVASQRVDIQDAPAQAASAPAATVAPRRIASADAANMAFAQFAEEMGAEDLHDMLEAAAAYTAFVEGAEDFSRPQLMSKVRESAKQEYSREDGLRSFGTLLREGRIVKVRNGRFQVSEETRFNPARRAG